MSSLYELDKEYELALNNFTVYEETGEVLFNNELLEQLEGVKTEYIAALPETEDTLKKQFRAIQYCNSFEHKGRTFNQYRVFVGSSKMDKAEMALLLDTVMDMASEVGIAPRISDYE